MQKETSIQTEVVKKLQACLKELGFSAEANLSEHEGLVYARQEMHGQCVRVVAHITDREVQPGGNGPLTAGVAMTRKAQTSIRPTLASRAATRYVEKTETDECD